MKRHLRMNKRFNYLFMLIVVIMNPVDALAFGSWNQETTAHELCFLFTLSKDWQQTLDISKKPDLYTETNPILGNHPSQQSVNFYFAGCAVTHALVSYMLPPQYAKIWQATWIGIQSNVTDHNTNNGLEQDMSMEYTINFSVSF